MTNRILRVMAAAAILVGTASITPAPNAPAAITNPLECAAAIVGLPVPPAGHPQIIVAPQFVVNALGQGAPADASKDGAEEVGLNVSETYAGVFIAQGGDSAIIVHPGVTFGTLVHEYVHFLDWHYGTEQSNLAAEVRAYKAQMETQDVCGI